VEETKHGMGLADFTVSSLRPGSEAWEGWTDHR
jgi:hypothetical protein